MEWMIEKGNYEAQIWPHDQRQEQEQLINIFYVNQSFLFSHFPMMSGMKRTDDG